MVMSSLSVMVVGAMVLSTLIVLVLDDNDDINTNTAFIINNLNIANNTPQTTDPNRERKNGRNVRRAATAGQQLQVCVHRPECMTQTRSSPSHVSPTKHRLRTCMVRCVRQGTSPVLHSHD